MRVYKSTSQIQRRIQRGTRKPVVEDFPEETIFIKSWGLLEDEDGNLVIHNIKNGERTILGAGENI